MKCNEKILKVTQKYQSKSIITLSKNYSVTSKSSYPVTLQVQEKTTQVV